MRKDELPVFPPVSRRNSHPRLPPDPWVEDARRQEDARLERELHDKREAEWGWRVKRFNDQREFREINGSQPGSTDVKGSCILLRPGHGPGGRRGLEGVAIRLEPPTSSDDVSLVLNFLGRHVRQCLRQGQGVEVSLSAFAAVQKELPHRVEQVEGEVQAGSGQLAPQGAGGDLAKLVPGDPAHPEG